MIAPCCKTATLQIMTRLAAERNPIYAQAHIHIKSETTPHDATVDAILKALP